MRTTAELREGFLSFFEERGHLRCPSASLVPRAGDDSTLLTTAGMHPQMPFFLGPPPPQAAPPGPRAGDGPALLPRAGMHPQMPFFLGLEPPPAPLTTTSQKCFRT